MDPLSIITGIIASLQVASSVLCFCYRVKAGMRSIPRTLLQIIDEVRDLRNLLETIESIFDKGISSDSETTSHESGSPGKLVECIQPVIKQCHSALQALERHISPEHIDSFQGSRRQALLHSIKWRLGQEEAKESIASLQRCKALLNVAMHTQNCVTLHNIERLAISLDFKADTASQRLDTFAEHVRTIQLDKEERAVVDWLSPLRPGQTHAIAYKDHEAGTSSWILQMDSFKEWLDGKERLLWLSGPPGSGKTMIISHIVELLAGDQIRREQGPIYAFAYCDFRDSDTQSAVNILGTILSQFCTQFPRFPAEVLTAHQCSTKRSQDPFPTIDIVSEAIQRLSREQPMYIFIDALDETGECDVLARQLVRLATTTSTIHVLVTSRNHDKIQRILEPAPRVLLEDHIGEVDSDIRQYIDSRLRSNPDLEWLNPELRDFISQSLVSKSKGVFRWATCQLDALRQCKTIRDVKKSLGKVSAGLYETYGRILVNIVPSDVHFFRKTLAWLALSITPISLHQLWEALAIESGCTTIDDECRLRSPQDIVTAGQSLITLTPSGFVTLAHLSVRDYLLSSEIKQDPKTAIFGLEPGTCRQELAKDCLTYLSLSGLSSGPSNTQEDYLARLKKFPLLEHATRHWFYYARNADPDENLKEMYHQLFRPESRTNFMSWVQVLVANMPFKWDIYPRHASSLYYAASLGLEDVVESLLSSATSDQINAPGSRFGGTALHAAAIREHDTIIELLAAAGADPSRADFNGVTPLHSAASQGSMRIIKLLLGHGAPTNCTDAMDGNPPAQWARLSGHLDAAVLIEQYANDTRDLEEGDILTPEGSSDGSSIKTESPEIEVWQPNPGYFPNFYERRSGLHSSFIVSITFGGTTSESSADFQLVHSSKPEDDPQILRW